MKTIGLTFAEPEGEKIHCPVCGKEYKSQSTLEKHLTEKHPEHREE